MTLQDAIRSGKPFRRPGYNAWIYPNPKYVPSKVQGGEIISVGPAPFIWGHNGKVVPIFGPEAILAEDWELRDEVSH